MFLIHLFLFVLAVLTPKIIQGGVSFLSEEDLEALIILCAGVLAFTPYLLKEKAMVTAFREKMSLQKQTNVITRDLSDSYSYIGEMNRKFEIVKDLIFNMPKEIAEAIIRREPDIYQLLVEAVQLLAKNETVSIRFVNYKTGRLEKIVERATPGMFQHFTAQILLAPKKNFWEEQGCIVIRSPRSAKNTMAFLVFPKAMNRLEDSEIFKILASQALFVYCIDEYGVNGKRAEHDNAG